MAKGQYEKWLEPDNLALLRGWKMKGLSDEEIAANIGVRRETIYAWKKKYPNISNALKKGKELANYAVENALLKKAINGNTTAMIFWLKNNYREKYTDDVTDPELRKAQIRRANAEANIKEYQANLLNGSSGDDKVVIVDDIPDEQSD